MFFDIFQALCIQKGVSCKKAAEEIGLSNSITTKWKKTGATPIGETLNKISSYFGVSVDYLLGKEKSPTETRGRAMDDDDLKFALWGDCNDIDDDDLADVKKYAAFVREWKKDK